jgi:hypothetical protein
MFPGIPECELESAFTKKWFEFKEYLNCTNQMLKECVLFLNTIFCNN